MTDIEYYYRYEAKRYSVCLDPDADRYGVSDAKLELHKFPVSGSTPKGVWVGYMIGAKDHWISHTSRKRFAHKSKEEALEAYIIRKQSYVRHSQATLDRALEDLALAERLSDELQL